MLKEFKRGYRIRYQALQQENLPMGGSAWQLYFFPGFRTEKDENGENLQSAENHGKGQ